MSIKIELQPGLYDVAVFGEFEKLCQESDFEYAVRSREPEIRNSAFDQIIEILLSEETLSAIVMGLATNFLYDAFKSCIVRMAKGTKSSKYFNSIKVETNNTELIIENEKIPEQLMEKGIDTFVKIALEKDMSRLSAAERMMGTTVIFPNEETDEVEILGVREYIAKHLMKNPNHVEEAEDGPDENAHAE